MLARTMHKASKPTKWMESTHMWTGVPPAQKSRFFSPRRLMLLAGVAGLGATVLLTTPAFLPKSVLATNGAAYAQSAQRRVGFADIVEPAKPAVISVRVKINGGPQVMGFDALPTPRSTPGTP